jgi:hypothetical protein
MTVFALTLLLAFGLAAGAHATHAPRAGQGKGSPALMQFQRDLVNVLALRAEAKPLLGAALLARTLPDPPHYVSFHALITRAAKASDAGPGVAWAELVDCDADAGECPNTDALATLKKQAPDDAAVWLMVLGQAAADDDDDAAQAALAKAAAASAYDDYAGVSLAALTQAASALPPPADLYGANGVAESAAGVRALLVFGLAELQPKPGLQATARLCEASEKESEQRQQCDKLAGILVWASSPLARSLGLHLQEILATDEQTRTQAADARRDLTWQVQHFGQLTLDARHDQDLAHTLLALARKGGTRMSLILAALRARQIPVQPPAGWKPAHAQE